MVTKETLSLLANVEKELLYWRGESVKIRKEIKEAAGSGEDVTAAGVRVYWKAGRKKIDHEAAVERAARMLFVIDEHDPTMDNHIERFTTRTARVAWAKVSKAADVDMEPFTTQAAPVLTIEVK